MLNYDDGWVQVHQGNCLEILSDLSEESVQCVVTSPPYWGLRKYEGEQEMVWGLLPNTKNKADRVCSSQRASGDATEGLTCENQGSILRNPQTVSGLELAAPPSYHCKHQWVNHTEFHGAPIYKGKTRWQHADGDSPAKTPEIYETGAAGQERATHTNFCSLCGAWRGAYGLEPTPEMYVEHTIEFLRAIRRVLRKDGVVFWNIEGIKTLGWKPQCNCDAETEPAIVLDPFAGSGTVGEVAKSLGRRAILIDTSEKYCRLAESRVQAIPMPMF